MSKWFNLSDNVNLLAFIGAAAIIIVTLFVAGKYIKQIRDDVAGGELTDDNWDGIGEYKNPLPMGWAVMFILTIVWSVWYMLMGYPLNGYSQVGEYNEEVEAYNAKFESEWANPSQDTLLNMGEGVFTVQCAPCHGLTADGINGKAADLTFWGSEDAILDAIMKGSKGMGYPMGDMPAGMVPDKQNAKAVAAYVAKEISAIKSTSHPELVETGKALWATCAACHGQDGKGLGGSSPDLTKYGSSAFVVDVLNHGKKGFIGVMPKFNNGLLTDIQKKAVGTYLTSLSSKE